jgi:hypothetical protein
MPQVASSGGPIGDDATILRKLGHHHEPKILGRTKPNSDLFKPSSDGSGTSVVVARTQTEIDETLLRSPGYWVRLTTAQIRSVGLNVEWQEDVDMPRHAGIVGWPSPKSARVGIQRALADTCEWEGSPPPLPQADSR